MHAAPVYKGRLASYVSYWQSEKEHSTMAARILENSLLQVTVLPESGGKISSLRSIRTGEEFLLPPLQLGLAPTAEDRTALDFSHGDLGGFDECLPSVAPSDSIGKEPPVPDHGDLWRHPWTIEASSPLSITLTTSTSSRPLRFTRTASLEEDKLILDYEIENTSKSLATWLWSAHPLLKAEAGDRIYLPSDVSTVDVEYSSTSTFNSSSRVQWPTAESLSGGTIDLSTIPPEDGITAYKLFARMKAEGAATLYRTQLQQGLAFHFDPSKLPYLGLWICAGAWPPSSPVRQYTVAIEPTTSRRDSLSDALAEGSSCLLAGGDRSTWRVVVQLLGAAAPYSLSNQN
jgi:hypothetical protein